MIRFFVASFLLVWSSTASVAASFTYSSAAISQLDYWLQHAERGDYFYDSDVSVVGGVSIVFEINERIRRNTTYVYDRTSKNWVISLVGGASGGIKDRWIEDFEVSITTGPDRQVIDWDFDVVLDATGVDRFFLGREGGAGDYEFINEDCVDEGNEEFDCVLGRGFGASDVGRWAPVSPVPLPASVLFLAAGALAFLAFRRRPKASGV